MAPDAALKRPGFDVESFCRAFDPHAAEYPDHFPEIYAYLREHSPVARSEKHGGFWAITRYDDVHAAAKDPATFSSAGGIELGRRPGDGGGLGRMARRMAKAAMDPSALRWNVAQAGESWARRLGAKRPTYLPIQADPPRAVDLRRVIAPLFESEALTRLDRPLRELAGDLVDSFIERGRADLGRDLVDPFTGIAIFRLAGLSPELWKPFTAYEDGAGFMRAGDVADFEARIEVVNRRIREAIWKERRNPTGVGALGTLVAAHIDGKPLADWEIHAALTNLLQGGTKSGRALLGTTFAYLAQHPERRRELRDHPERVPPAMEELLRFFPPVHGIARTATRDVEVHGQRIRAGDRVLLCLVSANRDPRRFENAEEIRFDRARNEHVTFGFGTHFCLGAPLARLETLICLNEVLSRLGDYELDGPLTKEPPASIISGYRSVPVRFQPGRPASR